MAVTEDDRRRAAMEVLERQILSIGRDVATLSADTLERLGAMLDVHAAELRAARLGSLDMRPLAARSTAAVAGHLGPHACALCLKRFGSLLPISDHFESLPRRSGHATAPPYAPATPPL